MDTNGEVSTTKKKNNSGADNVPVSVSEEEEAQMQSEDEEKESKAAPAPTIKGEVPCVSPPVNEEVNDEEEDNDDDNNDVDKEDDDDDYKGRRLQLRLERRQGHVQVQAGVKLANCVAQKRCEYED